MTPQQWVKIALSYTYMLAWIVMSGIVIIFNKWILSSWGFHFPITLTLWHMFFCSVLSFLLVRTGLVESAHLTRQQYIHSIVPIGALFSGTLWFGNAAYTTLSVSFIQMLKALMPACVYSAGLLWGVNKFDWTTVGVMSTVAVGVMIASYGEIHFVLTGVLFMLASLATESNRIVLVQKLLQAKGVQLNPVTTMYYVSPCCFAFLVLPWLVIELPELRDTVIPRDRFGDDAWLDTNGVAIFLGNAATAFALNCTVFLLIGNTSALTMNLAGVVKDWMLIYLSHAIFGAPVTALSVGGYLIAFAAVMFYNYLKYKQMSGEDQRKHDPAHGHGGRKAGDGAQGKGGAGGAEGDRELKEGLLSAANPAAGVAGHHHGGAAGGGAEGRV